MSTYQQSLYGQLEKGQKWMLDLLGYEFHYCCSSGNQLHANADDSA